MTCFHCNDTGIRGQPSAPWGPDEGRICNCSTGNWIREHLTNLAADAVGPWEWRRPFAGPVAHHVNRLGKARCGEHFRPAELLKVPPTQPRCDHCDDAAVAAAAGPAASGLVAARHLKARTNRLPCVFCDTEIDGPIVGAGDGTGRRFAHQVCWKLAELIREVVREAGGDSLTFSGAAVLLGRLKAILPKGVQ